MNNSKRLLELDVLRGLAALSVVGYHYTTRFDQLYGHSEQVLVEFSFGHYALQMFFMISGFVILMTLERTRKGSDFVISRLSRLYPAYWFAVVLTFAIVYLATLPDRQASVGAAIINLSMLQSFFGVASVDGVYWTLAVELTFYAIMLGLYRLRMLRHIEPVSVVWLALVLMTAAFNGLLAISVPKFIENWLIFDYANLFIGGMIFYRIIKQGHSRTRFGILILCLVAQRALSGWEATIVIAFFFMTFYALIQGRLSFIVWKPLLFLGATTYSLYLVHQNIGYVIIRALYARSVNPNLSIIVAILISFCLASVLTFFIERPLVSVVRNWCKKSREIRLGRIPAQAVAE